MTEKDIIKAGDILRIRSWEDMKTEYGLDIDGDVNLPRSYFFDDMRDLCGQIFVVESIDEYGDLIPTDHELFRIDDDWEYNCFMMEPVFDYEPDELEDIDNLEEFLFN